MVVPLDEMHRLVGHRFPGGSYRIDRWENFMMHDVMLVQAGSEGLAHPLYFFHLPIAGMGVTIQDIFDLCQADSPDAVRAGEYVWEIGQPLREGHEYRVSGSITEVHRKVGKRGGVMDFVTFVADVCETHDDVPCARISNTWIFLRGEA